jgi:hypothetical protein
MLRESAVYPVLNPVGTQRLGGSCVLCAIARTRVLHLCLQVGFSSCLGGDGSLLKHRSDSEEFLGCFFSSAGSPKHRNWAPGRRVCPV